MDLAEKMNKIAEKVKEEKLKTLEHYTEMKEIREKKHNEAQRRKDEKLQQKIEQKNLVKTKKMKMKKNYKIYQKNKQIKK